MRVAGRLLLISAAASLTAVASAQTRVESPADPYRHEQTGFIFPASIATALRHHVTRYNADGSDLGVDYQITREGRMIAFVSIFIYPAPSLKADTSNARMTACRQEFAGMKRDLLSHEADAALTQENEVTAPSDYGIAKGLRATFTGGRTKFDAADRDVREQADLFCYAGGKWLVAYRMTSLVDVDATPEIDSLIRALRWPAALAH